MSLVLRAYTAVGVCVLLSGCVEGDAPKPQPSGFRFSSPIVISQEADPEAKVFVADANDDSWLDVLTWGEGAPYLNLAIPDQGLSQPRKLAGVPSGPVRQAAWLDLTGDRSADLFLIDSAGVLRRFHAQSVDEYAEQDLKLPELPPLAAFAVLDADRDDRLDFVLVSEATESDGGDGAEVRVYVLRGAEGARYTTIHEQHFASEGGGQKTAFAQPTDVNRDGRWDIVVGIPGVGTGWLEALEPQTNAGADSGATQVPVLLDAGADANAPSAPLAPVSEAFRFHSFEQDELDVSGVAFIDYDNDGDVDWFRYTEDETEILENDGAGSFGSNSSASGLGAGGLGCAEDFDNDGRVDVLTAADDLLVKLGTSRAEFADGVELSAGSELPISSLVCADMDNDGDVDVLTAGKKGTGLYLNRLEPLKVDGGNYFDFRFVGNEGNAAALGTTLELSVGKKKLTRHFLASGQPNLAASPAVHLGLGTAGVFDTVRITWPNGDFIEDEDWGVNDTVTAKQPE